ncbi:MAG: Rpn family recombination-promoting nuclease/putative transposase, partial [Cytophagales bacterium]
YCQNDKGEKIIVELQKAKQNYFKDRTVYYSTFPIQEQAEKGDWNYELKAVYCIGVLDFTFDEKGKEVVHTVALKDQNNQIFYDKLKFVYLEMPNFNTAEYKLKTRLDKWLYFIKNLELLENIPATFKDEIFEQAFEKAEIAKYSEQERNDYEASLKSYRDLKGVIDTAFDEGKIEGKIEERMAVARKLKLRGLPTKDIAEITGLSEVEIDRI